MSDLLMEKKALRLRRTTRWSALAVKRVSKEKAGLASVWKMLRWFPVVALLFGLRLAAAEVIPPAPAKRIAEIGSIF